MSSGGTSDASNKSIASSSGGAGGPVGGPLHSHHRFVETHANRHGQGLSRSLNVAPSTKQVCLGSMGGPVIQAAYRADFDDGFGKGMPLGTSLGSEIAFSAQCLH